VCYSPETAEGRIGSLAGLEVPEVRYCVLLFLLESVEGGICLLEILEVLEAMRCVLLYAGRYGRWTLFDRR